MKVAAEEAIAANNHGFGFCNTDLHVQDAAVACHPEVLVAVVGCSPFSRCHQLTPTPSGGDAAAVGQLREHVLPSDGVNHQGIAQIA